MKKLTILLVLTTLLLGAGGAVTFAQDLETGRARAEDSNAEWGWVGLLGLAGLLGLRGRREHDVHHTGTARPATR